MAIYTTQTHLPPGGINSTSVGDGAHTYLVHDMIRGINNLAHVNNGATFAIGYDIGAYGGVIEPMSIDYSSMSDGACVNAQLAIVQRPIWIAPYTRRIRFTFGFQAHVTGATLEIQNVYAIFAATPYTAAMGATGGVPNVFTPPESWLYDYAATGLTTAAVTDTGYQLCAGSLTPCTQYTSSSGPAKWTWMLMTCLLSVTNDVGATATLTFHPYDSTAWCCPE